VCLFGDECKESINSCVLLIRDGNGVFILGFIVLGFNPHGGRGLIVLALFWDGNFSIKEGSWGNKFLSLWTFWKTKKNVFHSVFGWYRRCGCTFYIPHHGSHVQTQSSYIQKPLTSRVKGLIKFMPLLLNSQ